MYHGSLRKMIPVIFKRFASIEDRIERAQTTGTIGCGSDYHYTFGIAGRIVTPVCKRELMDDYLKHERLTCNPKPCWTTKYVDWTVKVNGLYLPSCDRCRRKRLAELGVGSSQAVLACTACCDWERLDRRTQHLLLCDSGENYPKSCRCPGPCASPVQPPLGREVGLEKLPTLKISFGFLKQSVRFAFFHLSKNDEPWTKSMAKEYLRSCGIITKHQDEICDAGIAARGVDVDYNDPLCVGGWPFPPAWTGDIEIEDYIEAVMHLLCLGIAKSVFELTSKWLLQKIAGKPKDLNSTAFRRHTNQLLKDLKKLQLSWLMAFPFDKEAKEGGETKTSFTTGGWVAENWLAFLRLAPVMFGFCCKDDFDFVVHIGFRDVARVILSLNAVAARVMTHGGVNEQFLEETKSYMKEFLSSVRELDIRLRYETLSNKAPKAKQDKGKNVAFWLKSNFMSLLNLVENMRMLGPMRLWMDGGGKGERFIQEIKPHIQRGVREDQIDYFGVLARKLYKERFIGYMEKRYSLGNQKFAGSHGNKAMEQVAEDEKADNLVDLVEALQLNEEGSDFCDSEDNSDVDQDDSDVDQVDDKGATAAKSATEHSVFSKVEEEGMLKKATIYIYRNEVELKTAINQCKPLAGLLRQKAGGLVFEILHRQPVKQFAHYPVSFVDTSGVTILGMWYAPVKVSVGPCHVASTRPEIIGETDDAVVASAVAIPLWYVIGKEKLSRKKKKNEKQERPDSRKYCVITNWWKVRFRDDTYDLPRLDSAWYSDNRQALTDDIPDNTVVGIV